MSRLRITLMTAATLLALAALTFNSLAQPPGRGGGGGGGGRGGFGGPGGGFGGGGFGGPGGGSLLQLTMNPAVQEDLKLKDAQKAKIKSLSDKYNAQMQELRGQMGGPGGFGGPGGPGGGPPGNGQGRGGRNGGGQNGGGQNAQPGDLAGGQNGQVGGGGGQGQDPNAPGGGRGNRGNRGNRNQNGQAIPEDPQVVAERQQRFEMMREAMTELRQGSEASLAKILDKTQVNRLKQISLQLEGNGAVLCQNQSHPHGDMIDKLQIDEAQFAMIQESLNEGRTAEREMGRSRRNAMQKAFAQLNPNGANGGQNNAGAGGNIGNGQNGQGGQNGQNGQGGRGGRRNFDPEAMRKVLESPEVKAQMDDFQSQQEKLTAQLKTAVLKTLSPRQRTTYLRMLGAPFDRSKMFTGGPFGGRGNNQAATKTTTASNDDDDEDAPKAKATAPAAPAKKATSPARKKSLRELRGEPSSDDN